MNIEQIVEKYIKKDDYFIIPTGENKSTIVFCMGYNPYKLLDKNHGQIDSYYYTSNISYFLAKDIITTLNENGYSATMSNEYIKPLVVKAKFGEKLKTTLVAVDKYGTKIVFQAIDVDGIYYKYGNYVPKELCKDCDKCVKACKNNALDNGFSRSDCLRNYQDLTDLGDEKARKAQGNNIIGCDICQRVCPYNKDIALKEVPTDLVSFLELKNLLFRVREGKKGLEFLVEHIGKNFLRVKRVHRLTVNAILNSGNEKLISLLNEEEKSGKI